MILEAFLQTKPDQVMGQGDRKIMVDKIRKRRGKNMLKPGRTKEGRWRRSQRQMLRRETTQGYPSKCGMGECGNIRER